MRFPLPSNAARPVLPRCIVWFACWLGGFAGAAPVDKPRLEIVSVEVNEVRLPPEKWQGAVGNKAKPLSLASVRSLRVEFQETDARKDSVHQLRHRLEGAYDTWFPSVAHAQMTVRFLDAELNILASSDYTFGSESAGWRGGVESSAFQPRSAELEVPSRAKWVQLMAVPSVPAMVGIYAFKDVRVSAFPAHGGEPRVRNYSVNEGVEMDNPLGSPANWARTGTLSEQARVVRLPDGSHALAIVDTDPSAYGAWILPSEKLVPVAAGEHLSVEWSECFSVALGGQGVAAYGYLQPGKSYRLHLGMRTVEGIEVEGGTVFSFEIPAPFWERPLVLLGAAASVLLFALGAMRYATKRRLERHLLELDRKHAVEKERARIARDIHDELGASLAQISLLSRIARQSVTNNPLAAGRLEEISARANGTAAQLAEIVWAVNPARDSLEHLVNYICNFAQEHLALAGIAFRADIPESLPEMPLGSSARHHIFRAVRELVHNATSHAHASHVFLRVECDHQRLVVQVEDDGIGFDPNEKRRAGGLENVRERMRQIGGEMEVRARPGQGTLVSLRIEFARV